MLRFHACPALLTCAVLVCAPGVTAAPLDHPLQFEAPASLQSLADQLRKTQDRTLAAALAATGLSRAGAPIHVLLSTEDSSLAQHVPPWVVGYASGGEGLIVIFVERVPSYPYDSVESVLTHELVHVFVTRATRGRAVPRWFNEGLATATADRWDLEDRTRLVFAMVGGKGVSRDELSELFGQGPGAARRAYVLSAAFIGSMIETWGSDFPGQLLALVSEDVPFADAFAQLTSATLDEFEDAFWAEQRWWNHWVPLLTSSTLLWAAMTLLVLYAFRRRRLQAVAIKERWKLEEEDGEQ